MKIRSRITKLIAITMAVAAMAVIGSIWTTQAQGGRLYLATDVGVYGFIPGQSLSFSVANLRTQEEGGGPVRVQAYIYDSYGNLLSQTDPVEVPPRQFRTIRFNRDDLRVAGEPGTGRVQVQPDFQFQADANQSFSPEDLSFTMELVNNSTGATAGTATPKFHLMRHTNATR